ncbi:hypothetical protein EIN_523460 [Entamoeba invadens IP1]|uniref:Uncharacterized protein n=1 Tax=Entamoeba invadens IP1 TaxID=370355 RepID=A0A0A1UG93_ENTIV|nr:hypothetical protein EIN_523460 [Entamoeba invadens IP1]ELP92458.1 hypothetical protein EIN_523460 [Entamoeba invadens IP1]|eukprot:XP_004259229.1 hypothetical protein EIN_523460 [Entamoeba invadens IP1]
MILALLTIVFVVNGSWEVFSDEDVLGWDNINYKTKEEAVAALHKAENETKTLENTTKEKIKNLNAKNNAPNATSTEKRQNRNKKRTLSRKLKEARVKLLNYKNLVKNF